MPDRNGTPDRPVKGLEFCPTDNEILSSLAVLDSSDGILIDRYGLKSIVLLARM